MSIRYCLRWQKMSARQGHKSSIYTRITSSSCPAPFSADPSPSSAASPPWHGTPPRAPHARAGACSAGWVAGRTRPPVRGNAGVWSQRREHHHRPRLVQSGEGECANLWSDQTSSSQRFERGELRRASTLRGPPTKDSPARCGNARSARSRRAAQSACRRAEPAEERGHAVRRRRERDVAATVHAICMLK